MNVTNYILILFLLVILSVSVTAEDLINYAIIEEEFEISEGESISITNSQGETIMSIDLTKLNENNVEVQLISSEGNLILKEDLTFEIGETKEVFNIFISLEKISNDKATFSTAQTSNCIRKGKLGHSALNLPCCDKNLKKIENPRFWSEPDGICYPNVGAFICINCGNNVCGVGESFCNCPDDCKEGQEGTSSPLIEKIIEIINWFKKLFIVNE